MHRHHLGSFTWIELGEATREELEMLHDELGFPSFGIDVALRPHRRPRWDSYEDHLLLVLKPATYVDPDEAIVVGQLAVLVGPKVIVTIGAEPRGQLRRIRSELEADPDALETGPMVVVHAIVDRFVDGYADILDGLETDVDEIESQVFSPERGSHAERIHSLKSEVQEFRRAAGPLPGELSKLLSSHVPPDDEALRDSFRDVRAKAVRAAEHIGQLDELLSSALDANLAEIGVQQNDDMRRISAWVAIVAAPTAMAGIYGMNFRYMPELQWRYGYFAALALMAIVCVVLYRLFKRSGWL